MNHEHQHDPPPTGGERPREPVVGDGPEPSTQPPPGPETSSSSRAGPGAGFFDSLRRGGLVRTDERWIGGVGAGLARRLDVDPLLVRGVFVVLTFFGGLGLLLYGLAWALLPEESDGRIHTQEALRGRFDAGLAGALVMVMVGLTRPGLWWQAFWWGDAWGLLGLLITAAIVVAVLVWVVPRARGSHGGADDVPPAGQSVPQASADRERAYPGGVSAQAASAAPAHAPSSALAPVRRDDRNRPMVYAVLGLALLALAAVQITGRLLDWDVSLWLLGGGVVLAVLGLGIVAGALRGRRAGGLGGWSVLVALLVLPLTLTLAVAPQVRDALSLSPHNVGDSYWAPDSADALAGGSVHTAGRLQADLSAITPDTTVAEPVQITLAAGQLLLDVPTDLDVHIRVQGTGSLRVEQPGAWYSQSARVHTDTDMTLLRELTLRSGADRGAADIALDLAVGAGEIVIRQVPPAADRGTGPASDQPPDQPTDEPQEG